MKITKFTQLEEECQHQVMVVSILLVGKIRQEAAVIFQEMWVGVVYSGYPFNCFSCSTVCVFSFGVFVIIHSGSHHFLTMWN